jgi:hypothetical protein
LTDEELVVVYAAADLHDMPEARPSVIASYP